MSSSFQRRISYLGITFNGTKANLDHLHKYRFYPKDKIKVIEWCNERFGYSWIWSAPTQVDYMDLFFPNEEDVIIFKLAYKDDITA